MVVYLVSALIGSSGSALQTAVTVLTTVSSSADFSGVAVREETLITASGAYTFVAVDDGDEVAAGQVLGQSLANESELESVSREKELENEISHVETLLSGITSAGDLTELDADVRAAILSLNAATSGGDLTRLNSAAASLTALIFPDNATVTESDLSALRAELAALQRQSYSSGDVVSPSSGLFTTLTDGLESLTPESLENLTVEGCKALMATKAQTDPTALGKLITGFRWYYAGLMDSKDAANFEAGDYVTVTLQQRYGGAVTMRVDSVSDADGGKCAVVFSTLKNLQSAVAMRAADSEVAYFQQTGLRVPTKALHVDENGDAFVYVITAMRVEIKHVETLTASGDYSIIAVEDAADSLREGNEVVVSGADVYEGMIIK